MSKLSTEDCRKFIVDFVSANPNQILDNWSDPDEVACIRKCLTQPSKWKRYVKFSATSNHESAEPEYPSFDRQRIPAEQLSWVREFYLNPTEFETAIGFQVLETVKGELIMGQDISD